MYRAIVVTVLAAGVALPASAQVFRCVAAGGAVSYQQHPCEGGAEFTILWRRNFRQVRIVENKSAAIAQSRNS